MTLFIDLIQIGLHLSAGQVLCKVLVCLNGGRVSRVLPLWWGAGPRRCPAPGNT